MGKWCQNDVVSTSNTYTLVRVSTTSFSCHVYAGLYSFVIYNYTALIMSSITFLLAGAQR